MSDWAGPAAWWPHEIGGEMKKAVGFGAWLFPHCVSNVGDMWRALSWFGNPPRSRRVWSSGRDPAEGYPLRSEPATKGADRRV